MPSQRNGFELCKVGIRSHSVLCTRSREESSSVCPTRTFSKPQNSLITSDIIVAVIGRHGGVRRDPWG